MKYIVGIDISFVIGAVIYNFIGVDVIKIMLPLNRKIDVYK